MLVVMKKSAIASEIEAVVDAIEAKGLTARPIPGGDRVAICILHNRGPVDASLFMQMPAVQEVIAVTRPYKLVSRESRPINTVIEVGQVVVGKDNLVIMAGPCAVESESGALEIARMVKERGAQIFRGGAYKPRTSPYAFQGLGEEGLKVLAKVRSETGMPVITEAIDHEVFDVVEHYVDIVQIGARNMQNFSLLRRAGKSKKPVLLKRGMAATIEEWLMAAEYIMEGGNEQVILCERGVRTFANHSRNTLDLSAVPVVKQESHLPVIVDPSHAAGFRDQVVPLARASVAVGCDGLIVEVHNKPAKALSDGAQSLYPDQFRDMCRQVEAIASVYKTSVNC